MAASFTSAGQSLEASNLRVLGCVVRALHSAPYLGCDMKAKKSFTTSGYFVLLIAHEARIEGGPEIVRVLGAVHERIAQRTEWKSGDWPP